MLQAEEDKLKCVSNERHFTIEAEINFRRSLPSHFCRVTEICLLEIPARVLRAGKVRLKAVSNEGSFTTQVEKDFLPNFPSH
jgi:hypothetical protein